MAKINILSELVCNRIAAGEVIDRPYSAVKELIENSIDAGATEIEIYIERGGKDLIRVVDNGCGIEKDDMRAAFFSHATSKISSVEDIDLIRTLGFRGEALATIASIAQVELISVTEGNDAWKVECDGNNNIGSVQPAALDRGTQITVRNLFFNTPARRKFLKTDKREENDITTFITSYILGNPRIAFCYYVDGKLKMQSFGGGLEEAISKVYGSFYLPQLFKISSNRNGLRIYGFIGNQNFFKSNKSYQNVFLNGRCISNNVISSAITQAYAPYAMKRNYPIYILFIEVPVTMVDVNVHPNKADVRFVDNQLIYATVYKVISSVLDGTTQAADFVIESDVVPEINSTFADKNSKNAVCAADYSQKENINDSSFEDVEMPKFSADGRIIFPKPDPAKQQADLKKWDGEPDLEMFAKLEKLQIEPKTKADIPYEKMIEPLPETKMVVCGGIKPLPARVEEAKRAKAEQERIVYQSWKYKGNLFNTYLIYEVEDNVYFIDQHAAHERLIFDSLMEKLKNRVEVPRQGMLVPFIIDLNVAESAFVSENLMVIRSLGFDIEQFGTTAYRINEVPLDLQNIDINGFFKDILSRLDSLKAIKLEDMLRDKLAVMACKRAVKGGMELTDAEKQRLIEMLKGDVGLKCPHGRPVCVFLTKTQIEKMFKRIV